MGINITDASGKVVRLRAVDLEAAMSNQQKIQPVPVVEVAKVTPIAPSVLPDTVDSAPKTTSNKASLSIDYGVIEERWKKVINTGDAEVDEEILKKIMESIKKFFKKLFFGVGGALNMLRSGHDSGAAPIQITEDEPEITGDTPAIEKIANRMNQLASVASPTFNLDGLGSQDASILFKMKMHAAVSDLDAATDLAQDTIASIKQKMLLAPDDLRMDGALHNNAIKLLSTMASSELAKIDPSGELHTLVSVLPPINDLIKQKAEEIILGMQTFATSKLVSCSEMNHFLQSKKLSFSSLMSIAQEFKSQAAVDGLLDIAQKMKEQDPEVFAASDLSTMQKDMVPPAPEKNTEKEEKVKIDAVQTVTSSNIMAEISAPQAPFPAVSPITSDDAEDSSKEGMRLR